MSLGHTLVCTSPQEVSGQTVFPGWNYPCPELTHLKVINIICLIDKKYQIMYYKGKTR